MGNASSKPPAGTPRVHFDVRLSSETCSASGTTPFYFYLFFTNLGDRTITIGIDDTPLFITQALQYQTINHNFIDIETGNCVVPYYGPQPLCVTTTEYELETHRYLTLEPQHETRLNYKLNIPRRSDEHQYSSSKAEKLAYLQNLERDKWYHIKWHEVYVKWWCYGDMEFVARNAPTKLPYHPPGDIGKPRPIILRLASDNELKFGIMDEKEGTQ